MELGVSEGLVPFAKNYFQGKRALLFSMQFSDYGTPIFHQNTV